MQLKEWNLNRNLSYLSNVINTLFWIFYLFLHIYIVICIYIRVCVYLFILYAFLQLQIIHKCIEIRSLAIRNFPMIPSFIYEKNLSFVII